MPDGRTDAVVVRPARGDSRLLLNRPGSGAVFPVSHIVPFCNCKTGDGCTPADAATIAAKEPAGIRWA